MPRSTNFIFCSALLFGAIMVKKAQGQCAQNPPNNEYCVYCYDRVGTLGMWDFISAGTGACSSCCVDCNCNSNSAVATCAAKDDGSTAAAVTDGECGAGFVATVSSTAACAAAPCDMATAADKTACCTIIPAGSYGSILPSPEPIFLKGWASTPPVAVPVATAAPVPAATAAPVPAATAAPAPTSAPAPTLGTVITLSTSFNAAALVTPIGEFFSIAVPNIPTDTLTTEVEIGFIIQLTDSNGNTFTSVVTKVNSDGTVEFADQVACSADDAADDCAFSEGAAIAFSEGPAASKSFQKAHQPAGEVATTSTSPTPPPTDPPTPAPTTSTAAPMSAAADVQNDIRYQDTEPDASATAKKGKKQAKHPKNEAKSKGGKGKKGKHGALAAKKSVTRQHAITAVGASTLLAVVGVIGAIAAFIRRDMKRSGSTGPPEHSGLLAEAEEPSVAEGRRSTLLEGGARSKVLGYMLPETEVKVGDLIMG